MTWTQNYTPLGNLYLSALVAAIPVVQGDDRGVARLPGGRPLLRHPPVLLSNFLPG